jgi:hypothetical protein
MNSYREIASDFRMWRESFDTDATMTQAEFDAMPVEAGVAMLVDAFGPEPKTTAQTVADHLAGKSAAYLEDIAAHGIHNITNNFHGDSDDEYQTYSDEFKRQADELLAAIEEAQRAEFRTT